MGVTFCRENSPVRLGTPFSIVIMPAGVFEWEHTSYQCQRRWATCHARKVTWQASICCQAWVVVVASNCSTVTMIYMTIAVQFLKHISSSTKMKPEYSMQYKHA